MAKRKITPRTTITFYSQLTEIKNKEKLFRSFEMILQHAAKKGGQEKTAELNKLKQELEIHRNRMGNAQLKMLDGLLDDRDYRDIKNRLEPQIERLERQIAVLEEEDPEEDNTLAYGFVFLRLLGMLMELATPEHKHQFLGSTFPEKFTVEDKKIRTNSDNPIVQALFSPDAGFEPPTLCL